MKIIFDSSEMGSEKSSLIFLKWEARKSSGFFEKSLNHP